jgi:uncharacterized protein (TIGR02145 family)
MKQKIIIILFLITITISLFWACSKDEELPKVTGINKIELTITEDTASYVFANIQCDLNQNPKFEIEQYGYCWDTIASVSIENENNSFENLTSQSFNETIENILPNKTYYVKAYIQNRDVIIYSNELTIQTRDARPIVTTKDISNILANSAGSGGTAKAYEVLFPITQKGICWAKTTSPTITDSLTINGTGNGLFTSEMKNLNIGINYYVRAYAIYFEGINYGEEKSFSTLDGIPDLTTDSANNITATNATIYGNIIENDGLEILEKGFCWNTSTNPTISSNYQVVTGTILGSYNAQISVLSLNTKYYLKSYVKNSEGTYYGNELSFTTEDGLPTVTTTTISNIMATSAESGGNIIDDGGFTINTRGVCWSTNSNPSINDNKTANGNGVGTFISNLSNLEFSTTYYVRAYATNINGTVYGEEYNFTTNDGTPDLTTTETTNIAATSATSGGNITDDGGFAITVRGVCWSTSTNPVITDAHTTDGTGTGSFTSNLTGLIESTIYFVRIYATNENGTVYGNEISFTTNDGIPDLTTTETTNIAATSATSGGNIIDDGGFAITARGVCWSNSTNPIITDAHTIDGNGTGSFTSSLTGLTEFITYYVRAYATNEHVTAYGNEISFIARNTISDYDGNIYGIVTIGNQTWMAENIKTTHYANGTEITLVENSTSWDALGTTDKAMCYYDNSTTNKDTYGALYTWAAAMNGAASSDANPSGVQGACPDGWHLPSDAEWKELEMYLGMSQAEADATGYRGTNEGSKLAGNAALWKYGSLENDAAFGTSGFLALPAGWRTNVGIFGYLGSRAYFWSAMEFDVSDTYDAYYRSLDYSIYGVYRFSTYKYNGFSVRCVKD